MTLGSSQVVRLWKKFHQQPKSSFFLWNWKTSLSQNKQSSIILQRAISSLWAQSPFRSRHKWDCFINENHQKDHTSIQEGSRKPENKGPSNGGTIPSALRNHLYCLLVCKSVHVCHCGCVLTHAVLVCLCVYVWHAHTHACACLEWNLDPPAI